MRGAVGHVERFNPALLELRRRQAGQLGEFFLISTERVGPFPDRVRDVGVVKDLATHDLDLVRWLGGAPVERVAAADPAPHGPRARGPRARRPAAWRTASAFNCIVDWLSPTKVRRTRILGELGMLVADTLTGDLTFFDNGHVARVATTQQLRGVTEGDMTRYALARREPLLVELEAFCAFSRGDDDAPVVTLEEGLETVLVAEAVLDSARSGETVRWERVVVKAVVVALGKIGLPLAAQIALRRPRGRRLRHRPARGRARQRRPAAVPRRGRARRGAGRGRRRRAPARGDRHGRRRRRGAGPRRRRAAARGRRRRPARTGGILDAVVADIGRGLQAGHHGRDRDDAAGRHDAQADRAGARAPQRPARRGGLLHASSRPERVYSGRVFADLATYPKLVGGLSAAGEVRGVELYAAFLDAEVRGRWARAEAAELTKLAETTYRDVNIAFANELARFADALGHRRATA